MFIPTSVVEPVGARKFCLEPEPVETEEILNDILFVRFNIDKG